MLCRHFHHIMSKTDAIIDSFYIMYQKDRIQVSMRGIECSRYSSYIRMNNSHIHHYRNNSHEHMMYKQTHPYMLHRGTHNLYSSHCEDISHGHNQNNIEMHYKLNMRLGIADTLMWWQGSIQQSNPYNLWMTNTSNNLLNMQYNYQYSRNILSCIHYSMYSINNAGMKENLHISHISQSHSRSNQASIGYIMMLMYISNILTVTSHNSCTLIHRYGIQVSIICKLLHPHTLNNPLSISHRNHMSQQCSHSILQRIAHKQKQMYISHNHEDDSNKVHKNYYYYHPERNQASIACRTVHTHKQYHFQLLLLSITHHH